MRSSRIPPRRPTRFWKLAKRWTPWPASWKASQPRKLQDATTRIYEACGFQDITGQRITKVVNTLKIIEAKVGQLVSDVRRVN